jgi:hypothetical protein
MSGFFQQEYYDKHVDRMGGGKPLSVRDRLSSENSSNISFSGVSGAGGEIFPQSRRDFDDNFN